MYLCLMSRIRNGYRPRKSRPIVVTKNYIVLRFPCMKVASGSKRAVQDERLAADTRSFYEALSELLRLYQFRDRDRICCHDISITQCYALEALARERTMTLNDLASHLYLDKSTTSRVVDALERKGYAVRSEHPADGRALRLKITTAGVTLHSKIMKDILTEEEALLAEFDPQVRRSMTQVIMRLAKTAESRLTSCASGCCTQ
jgi:MarR family transcriptional regulator, 2-MHQ and catechol-resistance regulon repressor